MTDSTQPVPFNAAYTGPRPDILQLIPASASRFLDIGCSDGTLGASIKTHWPKAYVSGMELSPEMGAVAAQRLDHVLIGDIEQANSMDALTNQTFDVVIMADILEHLRDPWDMLRRVRSKLSPGAIVVTSIPNIRHFDTLFNLAIKGEWPYRDRGIHDRTHLRFFTKKNIIQMFESGGYEITDIRANYRLIERPHPFNRYTRWFTWPGLKSFLAFQYLIQAKVD